MAFTPYANRALRAAAALCGAFLVSAPAAAQYYSAFPGATYSKPQLPRRGQAPDIFPDPRYMEERETGRFQTAGFWPQADQSYGASSYEPRAARLGGTRQIVSDPTGQPAGSITVDTRVRRLYLSLGGGQAMAYGIGVGRRGWLGPRPQLNDHRFDHLDGDVLGDLQSHFLVLHADDLADHATGQNHRVPALHRSNARRMLLGPALLRHENHHVKKPADRHQRENLDEHRVGEQVSGAPRGGGRDRAYQS
jgi:hypothetical protein